MAAQPSAPVVPFATQKAWSRVLARTMITDRCWIFLGAQSGKGYGCASRDGETVAAHRIAYEATHGQIPVGMVIDHTCHDPSICVGGKCPHRLCVNPAHLAPSSNVANLERQAPAAKTHCIHGHRYTDLTTGWSRGRRYCKTCRSERAAEAAKNRPERHARSRAIRSWATTNGIPVARRGRVSDPVVAAWQKAGSPGYRSP